MRNILLLLFSFATFKGTAQTDAAPFGLPPISDGISFLDHAVFLKNDSVQFWQENLKSADSLIRFENNPLMLSIDAYILGHSEETREAYLVSMMTQTHHFRVYFFKDKKGWHSWTFSIPKKLTISSDEFKRWLLLNTLTVNQIEENVGFEIENCKDGFDEIDLQIDDSFTLDDFCPKNFF